jgi:cellulose synthase/poly-beta-1,6-N-acetylglucosamine synthase-like glycosyltransferase
VEFECKDWASKKINIKYEIRESRKGYKAGALKKGMEHSYAQECDFVAIFDADFQPDPDFLLRTIPFLVHNPKIALVQTRWEFGKQSFRLHTFFSYKKIGSLLLIAGCNFVLPTNWVMWLLCL